MNLLQETLEDIASAGKTPEDILFIGSEESGHSCTWDEFTVLADFDYDNGYGSQKIAGDLIIAFKDGSTMWRHEYDGSEGWDYSTPFTAPTQTYPISSLGGNKHRWLSLAEINKGA